ncbi:hypothetical protein WEB32_00635 [Streptomyces netropsis]|uniref:hypothetical protein n=1 Tax=Streptomyces netropsis TaxID=55404 RepID=UPI001670BA77|nr:hypothetical protein [Streptomyces netropsis]
MNVVGCMKPAGRRRRRHAVVAHAACVLVTVVLTAWRTRSAHRAPRGLTPSPTGVARATAAALEQLTRDVTGWPAHAVAFSNAS